jgi:hypothetical protein
MSKAEHAHTNHTDHELLSALEGLEPVKRTRAPKFTREAVTAFYSAISRGVTWGQINETLAARNLGYETSQKLASAVNDVARVYGIANPRAVARKGAAAPAMTDAAAVTLSPERNGATNEPERELVHAS